MMGHRGKLKGGDEWDILAGARSIYKFTERPGVCRAVKNKYARRQRRIVRQEIRRETP